MSQLLKRYMVAVEHAGVSGFEHLEMLMIRDRLVAQEHSLSLEEQEHLITADRRLIAQAPAFHAELSRVTSLEYERQRRNVSPSRWWWYLDVLARLPQTSAEPAYA